MSIANEDKLAKRLEDAVSLIERALTLIPKENWPWREDAKQFLAQVEVAE